MVKVILTAVLMKIDLNHAWVKTVAEAKEIQQQLQPKTIATDRLGEVRYVAGVDIGFEDNYKISKAAMVVLSYPELKIVDRAIAHIPTAFPYIPGYLSFREIPAILAVLPKINQTPDLIMCDGQGLAHPRRFGLACHLGVLLDIPTIGVAKSRFIGEHEEVPIEKGSWQPLIDKEETIGVILRSRTKVKPIYVSIGHKISLPTAIDYVMGCLTKYRLPETTRQADKLASSKS